MPHFSNSAIQPNRLLSLSNPPPFSLPLLRPSPPLRPLRDSARRALTSRRLPPHPSPPSLAARRRALARRRSLARRHEGSAMMNFSLLSLVLLLAVSPLAAFRPVDTECVGDITYAANSTYEANVRRLAAVLPAGVSASQSSYTYRAVGFWPNRVRASSFCQSRDDEDGRYSSCAACIAAAFRELERTCPYHKEALIYDDNCTLELSEVNMGIYGASMLEQILASGLIFQAIGFAWLFFLLLQEWRGRKRGTAILSTPPVTGDH